ncbi:dihydroorotate dehydrogenase (quinone) [Legionella quinlivanii]|uniref:Dihydroorotate dehydrogenase (quinone) n=1 Tax=Legionella quinlivanii TaxID=45073 RepID=A0A364LNS8_9GAMM|nr:quinone-dependent dihydroorotate dehydrogenase [Legionella quinlivanii]RAP38638.1 dihydroorotate dehydrogenase (quinone) [Legionella quinlivanii]
MYSLIRPLLFSMDAEKAHRMTLALLDSLPAFCFRQAPSLPVDVLGMRFNHPVGLAAGLDKNASHLDGLAKLGFSFVEVGTVTPRPQAGMPKPRLFRLPNAEALINRMGFNNRGVDVLVNNIQKSSYRGILGINIGKNKDTPMDKAVNDYLFCLKRIYTCASYITINISSPNTPDLRLFHQEMLLTQLLTSIVDEQKRLSDQHQRFVPLVIKLSPDESDEELKIVANVAAQCGISGIIATNTTCTRVGVENLPESKEMGGLSGKPLQERSTQCIRVLKEAIGNQLIIIGAGGIQSVEAAKEKLIAGASLLQVYTGLIYKGPQLISQLVKGLKKDQK